MKFLLPLLLLCGCAAPKWQGFFLGPAMVTPARQWSGEDGVSIEGNAVWSIPNGTLQLEVIEPVTHPEYPAFRAAVNWRVF